MTTNECKVRLLDEVSAVVVGLHGDHMEHLYNKFAVPSANYFFNPRFKLGQWDGKIRYFHKTGKTFIYLLEDILPRLVKFGYKVVIEDLRTTSAAAPDYITDQVFAHIPHLDTGKPTILRLDQVEAVNKLIEAGSGICLAGTGAGKTLMCSALVKAYDDINVRSLTIVPDQGLIRQTKAEYINCGLDTGEYSGTHKTLEHRHVVSTWQALKNNPKIVELFQMVIVDECHGLRGNVLTKIICDHAARLPYRFGFTGTLPKDEAERMSVHVAVGPVRHVMPAKTLIDMGVLADIHIDVIQLEEDLHAEYKKFCDEDMPGSKPPTYIQFKDGYFPDFASEKSYIHRNELRIEWIAEFLLAKQDSKNGNILCLVDSIPFGRKLAELIPGAIFVNGQDIKTAAKRQEVYDLFKTRNDLVVIATVHIAGTGLNIKRIFNLIFIDIGKSFTRVIQGIGRGLRKAEDKDSVTVTDICSDLKYGKKHLKMRTNYYEEAQYPFKKHKIDYVKQMGPLAGFE
jgi:superfamily II DNA or RNA helicase